MKKSKQGGFTLIELIVVIMVTAIAVTTLLHVMGELTVQSQRSQLITVASNLGRERMEEILADRFTFAQPFNSFSASAYPLETPVGGFAAYDRSVQIDYVNLADLTTPVAGPTNYKRIEVTVNHSELGDVSTATIVSRRPNE